MSLSSSYVPSHGRLPAAFSSALVLSSLFVTSARADYALDPDVLKLDALVVSEAPLNQTVLPVTPSTSVYAFPTSPLDTPRSLSQITAKLFSENAFRSVDDFIYYTPGLTKSAQQTVGQSPIIRGQAAGSYQNGILNGLTGNSNSLPLATNPYESADIVAGPASVVYGPSPLSSGSVNYITKRPFFDRTRGWVNVDFGRWVSGGYSYPALRGQVDVGGPIVKEKLAYRLSVQAQKSDSFIDRAYQDYYSLYGALRWLPRTGLTLEYNATYNDFRLNQSSGWNRVTQDLVDNGVYLDGPAIPVIRRGAVGNNYYSPILNRDGTATGTYLQRERVGTSLVYRPLGSALTEAQLLALPGGGSGSVVGYVLDPALTVPTKIAGNDTNNNGTSPYNEGWNTRHQLKVTYRANENTTWVNTSDLDAGKFRKWDASGYTNNTEAYFLENRTELQVNHRERQFFGLPLKHQSSTGIALRYEWIDNPQQTSTPTTNAFGNFLIPGNSFPNDFFYTQVQPSPTGGSKGGLFGPIAVDWRPTNPTVIYKGVPAQPGIVVENWDFQGGLFTQHNFNLGEHWGFNVGGRGDYLNVNVKNPITYPGRSLAGEDDAEFILPSTNVSLIYKPHPKVSTYFTFAYGQAYNGGAPANFSLRGGSGTSTGFIEPANFHSRSVLYEAGVKYEPIANTLIGSVAVYHQERSQYVATTNTADPIIARGIDASLRWQVTRNFSAGLNLNWIDIHYVNYNGANNLWFSGQGITVDNATLFGNPTLTNTIYGYADYRVPAVPEFSASGFVQYEFASGFGLNAKFWATSSWNTDISNLIVIGSQHNLDLGAYYQRGGWRVQVDVLNVTNEFNIRPGLGNGSVFATEPISLEGRITYAF